MKLLVNRETGEACAMKEVDLDNHPDQVNYVYVLVELAILILLCSFFSKLFPEGYENKLKGFFAGREHP